MKARIVIFVVVGVLLAVSLWPATAQNTGQTGWPTERWQSSSPEEQGIDSAQLSQALYSIRQQDVNIHSLMLIRNGSVVLDTYFYPYDGQSLHDLASVTKSVMTTLTGIAIDQGKLSLDDPMLSFFPDRIIANRNAWKERITVRHLASMSSGLDCTSERDEATLQEMRVGDDWVQFTLDREVKWEPGSHFVYCSPAMHLLSPILQQATGMSTSDFARRYLFEPLGIHDFMWLTDPQGYNRGSEGLYLHPRDMAKLGYLWMNDGIWDGEQIVSADWVKNSVTAQISTGGEDDYGYGWWLDTQEPISYSANGRGGQYIIVVPVWNLMVVTTGGGYDFDEIEPFIVAALSDMSQPLPANPDGITALDEAIALVAQPPAPDPVAVLPDMARVISGKTFVFEPNRVGIEALLLEFDDTAEAALSITIGRDQVIAGPVALDGVYRFFSGSYDLPMGLRGQWIDDHTFALEYDAVANNDHGVLQMSFEGDHVTVEQRETAHEGLVTIEGRLVEP